MKKDGEGRVFLYYDPDSFKLILKKLRGSELDPNYELKMPSDPYHCIACGSTSVYPILHHQYHCSLVVNC